MDNPSACFAPPSPGSRLRPAPAWQVGVAGWAFALSAALWALLVYGAALALRLLSVL